MSEPGNCCAIIDEMIDHIDYILDKVKARSQRAVRENRDTRQSIERSLDVISASSRRLPIELKDTRREIPWRQLADIGNVLRHTHFAVNPDLVWRVATDNLVPLRQALVAMRELALAIPLLDVRSSRTSYAS
jgi:uncharacterized protein with HEPN domain